MGLCDKKIVGFSVGYLMMIYQMHGYVTVNMMRRSLYMISWKVFMRKQYHFRKVLLICIVASSQLIQEVLMRSKRKRLAIVLGQYVVLSSNIFLLCFLIYSVHDLKIFHMH
jgi:hypothetical protein